MNKKLHKNSGFTLIEMLVVVAIIAILIAVSIPLLNNALEKARDSTDQANERAAKAVASMVFMQVASTPSGAADPDAAPATYYSWDTTIPELYYDAASGELLVAADAGDIVPYGKCAKSHGDSTDAEFTFADPAGGPHNTADTGVISVEIDENGGITITWGGAPT